MNTRRPAGPRPTDERHAPATPLDRALVQRLAERGGHTLDDNTAEALARAIAAPRAGHVGVRVDAAQAAPDHTLASCPLVDTDATLQTANATAPPKAPNGPGNPVARPPFVLQRTGERGGLLMTRRYWRHQQALAQAIRHLLDTPASPTIDDVDGAVAQTDTADAGAAEALHERQRDAVRAVLARRLVVITGGPGTGKTTTIRAALRALLGASPEPLAVVVAAPTGKAAARAGEALSEGGLEGWPEHAAQTLQAIEPGTVHRLLGVDRRRPQRFVHGPDRPLRCDVLIVDEVSMVDVALMRRLLEAVPPGARVVLLGDAGQLASVQAGSVLADLVRAAERGGDPQLSGARVHLTHSWRFGRAPRIAAVVSAIADRSASPDAIAAALRPGAEDAAGPPDTPDPVRPPDPDPHRIRALAGTNDLLAGYVEPLRTLSGDGQAVTAPSWLEALRAGDDRWHDDRACLALLEAVERYRVLSSHRHGPRGVDALTRTLERALQRVSGAQTDADPRCWAGRPIIVRRNDRDTGLFNGDVGVVLPVDGRWQAVFRGGSAGLLRLPFARVPAHDTALVLTIHQSQGSQFDHVAVVLPERRGSPLLTRELVYTALSRARWQVSLLATRDVLQDALRRRVARASGLDGLLMPS